jgi:hypothetical protein
VLCRRCGVLFDWSKTRDCRDGPSQEMSRPSPIHEL